MAARAKPAPAADRALRTQGRKTMARLLDAGTAVLTERGYRATRVDDIVRHACTSHGTFYQYFASKDDLVRSLASAAVDEMGALAGDLGPVGRDDAGRAELRRFVGGFHAAYERHGAVVRAWAETQIDDRSLHRLGQRTFARMTETVAARIAEAGAVPAAEVDLAATACMATIERLTYFVTSRPLGLPVDGLLDELASMLHRGFFGGGAGAPDVRASQRRAARSPRS
jgi:AcrR family transcriptional regulator